jgi:hypothetical protein
MPDRYPTIGICVSCGKEIKHSPIRMPLGRPMINPEKPGHYGIEYSYMCVSCVDSQLKVLREKIRRGEMYPTRIWWGDDEGNLSIVPLNEPSSPVEEIEEPSVGFLRWVWSYIW